MDIKLFDQVYKDYQKSIMGFFAKRVSNYSDCEEMTSDVFTNFYKHMESYDETRCKLSTWLFVIADNRLKNYYRAMKDDVSMDEIEMDFESKEISIEDGVLLDESRQEMLNALDKLSERERSLIILRFYEGMSGAETAERLGISEINARVIQKRALEKLKKILSQ